ncbi:DUF6464 family protein [Brasilonema sp. UFV-L1]|uniref:DUF6464 family protein n=1 Tax=Brasilonema sp. UFV-L1 TaxID=2234130 RepID=UPI00145E6ACF|nr:DUF6464 family protein [Brasilonema sp. UFV-L1]NMG10837.1 hypothetical protein [Brasilonema sp. UFV-L1]
MSKLKFQFTIDNCKLKETLDNLEKGFAATRDQMQQEFATFNKDFACAHQISIAMTYSLFAKGFQDQQARQSAHILANTFSTETLGDCTCKYNAHSTYLKCAVNPMSDCKMCPDYEKHV